MIIGACQLFEHLGVWTNASNKGHWHFILCVLQQWKAGTMLCTSSLGCSLGATNQAASCCCCRVSYYATSLGRKAAFCCTGQATALGGADLQPVTDDNTTKDAAAANKGSSDVSNQATADRHEAEEQPDDDWEPSPAKLKRKAATRGCKKAEPAKKPRRGHKQQPVVDSDSQDSESFAEEEELASRSQLTEVPAVRKSQCRKHQVRPAASV